MPLIGAVGMVAAAAMLQPPSGVVPADDPAGRIAGATFVFGCIEMLGAASSPADYAARAQQLSGATTQMLKEAPQPLVGSATAGGVDGRTCRVTYKGPNAERLFRALSDFSKDKMNGECAEEARTPTRAAVVCKANKGNPAYRQSATRDGDGLVLDLTYVAPPVR